METVTNQPRQESYNPDYRAHGAIGDLAVQAAEQNIEKRILAEQMREQSADFFQRHEGSRLSRIGRRLNTSTNHFAVGEQLSEEAQRLEDEAVVHDAEIAIGLSHTRTILGSFDRAQSGALDELLSEEHTEVSPFIRSLKPEHMTWAQWLSDTEHGASDEQLLNFLQWHEDHYTRHNTEEDGIDQLAEAEKFAKQQFQIAYRKGLLPKQVVDAIGQTDRDIMKPRFVFEDIIRLAAFKAVGYARQGGMSRRGKTTRPVRGSTHIASLSSTGTLLHEFSHSRIGNLRNSQPSTRWIDEAVTETISIAADTSTADIYTYRDGESYPIERALLLSVIDSSNGEITRDMCIALYAGGSSKEKTELLRKINTRITNAIQGWMSPSLKGKSFSEIIDDCRAHDASSHASEREIEWLEAAILSLQQTLPPEARLPNYEIIRERLRKKIEEQEAAKPSR